MTMQDLATAQARYDVPEPPDKVECCFCDGPGVVVAVRVRGSYDDEADWPTGLDEPEVPCPYCLAGTPLQRSLDNA